MEGGGLGGLVGSFGFLDCIEEGVSGCFRSFSREVPTVHKLERVRTLETGATPVALEAGLGSEFGAEALESRGGVAFFGAGLKGQPGYFGDGEHDGRLVCEMSLRCLVCVYWVRQADVFVAVLLAGPTRPLYALHIVVDVSHSRNIHAFDAAVSVCGVDMANNTAASVCRRDWT